MKRNKLTVFSFIVFIMISVYLLVPILATFLNSVFSDYSSLIPKGFTFKYYVQLMQSDSQVPASIVRTIVISIVPTLITFVMVIFSVFAIKVYFPKLDKYLSVLSKIPYGIQGVIIAVSVLSLYASGFGILSNRIFLLASTYCIMILPYMYQGVKNSVEIVDMKPILEAAEVLGHNKLYTFTFIIIPAIMRGLLATILLCIGILLCDFVLVNILAGSYFPTLGIVLNEVRVKSGHIASGISIIIFVIMLILSIILTRLNREKEGE